MTFIAWLIDSWLIDLLLLLLLLLLPSITISLQLAIGKNAYC